MMRTLQIALGAAIVANVASVASIGRAHAQSTSPYVPEKNLSCRYGVPPDALRSLPPQRLTAAVRVTLDVKGKVADAVLEWPSGNAAFDDLAVRQSRKSACKPFVGPDGRAIAVETNFVFDVPAGTFRPDAASETFAYKVQRLVRANLEWTGSSDLPVTMIAVHCADDGKLLSATIVRSSGNRAWDAAALKAVQRSDPMPQDANGKTPKTFNVSVRPS